MSFGFSMDSNSLVQKTSDLTTTIKARAVELGYYEDEFIDKFVETSSQATLMTIVHVVRSNAFRLVLDKFIQSFPDQTVQFVNLGAGFDTISFYAMKKYPNVICFDTDFDDQMKTKSKIIYENDCFKQLLPDLKLENGFITSNKYKIVPFDLSNINDFNNLINAGLSPKYPTFYLAEFVFMYVKSEYVNEMLLPTEVTKFYNKVLSSAGVKVYGPLEYPSIESQIQRYSKRWNVKMVCYSEFYNMNTSEEEKKRIIVILHMDIVFQELEDFKHMRELGVFCSHFFVTVLYKHELSKVLELFNVEDYNYVVRGEYDIPFGLKFDYNTEFNINCFNKIFIGNVDLQEVLYRSETDSNSSFLNEFNVKT
uniref:[phosphatase 2A protein]-leucine-carboxy methyltransferase n=1 Tax=Theileria annulata TaxID=5874 RepID=A0A3B0NHE5_THEAN